QNVRQVTFGEDFLAASRKFKTSGFILQQFEGRVAQPVVTCRGDRFTYIAINIGMRTTFSDNRLLVGKQVGDTDDFENGDGIEMQIQHDFCPADQRVPCLAANTRLSPNTEPGLLQAEQNCVPTLIDRPIKQYVNVLDQSRPNVGQLRHVAYRYEM